MNGERRRIHNEGLHSLYRSPNSQGESRIEMDKSMEECRSAFKILTGTHTYRSLGRPRRRWEDNIRTDLKEKGINSRNWIDSVQDSDYWRALVNAALTPGFHKPWS